MSEPMISERDRAAVELQRVIGLAKGYHVPVTIVPDFDALCDCALRSIRPRVCYHSVRSAWGICTSTWSIRISQDGYDYPDHETPRGILHELAHVLDEASTPSEADELGPMLAFEYEMGQRLNLVGWHSWMLNFLVNEQPDGTRPFWPDLSPARQQWLLRQSRMRAVRHGILAADMQPTYFNPRQGKQEPSEVTHG